MVWDWQSGGQGIYFRLYRYHVTASIAGQVSVTTILMVNCTPYRSQKRDRHHSNSKDTDTHTYRQTGRNKDIGLLLGLLVAAA